MLHGCNYNGVILPCRRDKRKGELGSGDKIPGPGAKSARSATSEHFPFVVQEVHQHVVTQVLWGREEGPSAV